MEWVMRTLYVMGCLSSEPLGCTWSHTILQPVGNFFKINGIVGVPEGAGVFWPRWCPWVQGIAGNYHVFSESLFLVATPVIFWGVRQELVTVIAPTALTLQQREQYQWKNSSQGLCRVKTTGLWAGGQSCKWVRVINGAQQPCSTTHWHIKERCEPSQLSDVLG